MYLSLMSGWSRSWLTVCRLSVWRTPPQRSRPDIWNLRKLKRRADLGRFVFSIPEYLSLDLRQWFLSEFVKIVSFSFPFYEVVARTALLPCPRRRPLPEKTFLSSICGFLVSLSIKVMLLYLSGENEEVMVMDEPPTSRKRKAEETQPEMDEQQELKSVKRPRVSSQPEDGEDDIVVLWEQTAKLSLLRFWEGINTLMIDHLRATILEIFLKSFALREIPEKGHWLHWKVRVLSVQTNKFERRVGFTQV